MTTTWSDRIKTLCERIVREQDPDKLGELAMELDRLVAEEQDRRKQKTIPQASAKN